MQVEGIAGVQAFVSDFPPPLRCRVSTSPREPEKMPENEDENDETFESTDAGASETYPMEAGQIRKGGHIMIKGNPCKVIDVSTSKTGKHGHAKCHFTAQDIFSGKKMEDLVPASHTTNVPFVKKVELQCMGVDDDGFVSLLTDDGGMREDIKLPNTLNQAPPDAEEVSKRIQDFLEKETGASPRLIAMCFCACAVLSALFLLPLPWLMRADWPFSCHLWCSRYHRSL